MKRNRGFTLIELLVVIAIIGILSSVVLASLNTARGKGADAAVKANLANARAQAELYYDDANPDSYDGVCAASSGIAASLSAVTGSTCSDSLTGWTAVGPLSSGTFCVDSAGAANTSSTTIVYASVANWADGTDDCDSLGF
jgi:prepilin-type N-terminal cleavage/methylation domain-containing protein